MCVALNSCNLGYDIGVSTDELVVISCFSGSKDSSRVVVVDALTGSICSSLRGNASAIVDNIRGEVIMLTALDNRHGKQSSTWVTDTEPTTVLTICALTSHGEMVCLTNQKGKRAQDSHLMAVGSPAGTAVGASVGSGVGPAEGTGLGPAVGSPVGSAEGAVVGNAVGAMVGSSVGTAEGAGLSPATGAAAGLVILLAIQLAMQLDFIFQLTQS